MSSYSDQAGAARFVSQAKTSLDVQVRLLAMGQVATWMGEDKPSLASGYGDIETVVRSAYHTGAALARAHVANEADIPGWVAPEEKRTPPYLKALLADVRTNMRAYLNGPRDEKAQRRLVLRVQHSAGIASQRGYTDAMLRAADSLAKIGVQPRKVWAATGPNPCAECINLHGTEKALHEHFETTRTRVYRDLLGPPAHPHCHCTLVLFLAGADNITEKIDLEAPVKPAAKEMSSNAVKGLNATVFTGLIAALTRIIMFLVKGK
jgi:hypothetical protein